MWRLTGDRLPQTPLPEPTGAPLCFTDLNQSLAPLCRVDFQANYVLPGIQTTSEPTTLTLIAPQNNGSTLEIPIEGLTQIDAVTIGDRTYTQATGTPQPGQFAFNGSILTLIPHPSSLIPPNTPILVLGGRASTPTDHVDPSILGIFYGLPVVAEVRWSMSAENHPSGAISLRVIGDNAEQAVAMRFRKGTELTFAGVGFSVTNYQKTLHNTHEAPDRVWDVSISLGGKWERRKYSRPSFLIPGVGNRFPQNNAPFLDPDCTIDGQPPNQRAGRPDSVSVDALASQVGARFAGGGGDSVVMSSGRGNWSIPIPKDATVTDTINWLEVADSLKRQNGCFLDYSFPDAVRARAIDSGARWSYTIPAIDVAYKGDCEKASGVEGFAIEYAAVRLTGEFSEPKDPNSGEDTQGKLKEPPKVKWKKREIVIKTFRSGDVNPSSPPETFPLIRNLNANWDTSGPTKEFIEVTTHDGIEMLKIRRVWGLSFTSDQVMQDLQNGEPIGNSGRKRGPIISPSAPFWGVVQQEVTETQIDDKTRYILGSKTLGFRLGRFQQETDNLEVLGFLGQGDADSIYRRSLYQFKAFPTYAAEKKRLEQFASYYNDARNEPIPVDYEKICLADGSSKWNPVRNPNWVEPMFVSAHLSYSNSFAWTRNPDDQPTAPLPPLTQGEERQTYKFLKIIPSKSTTTQFNFDNFGTDKSEQDLYLEYTQENSTQGAGFGEYTSRRTFSTNDGRPSPAQRLPDLYEREEPEPENGDPNAKKSPDRFEYILCTPGHSPNDPPGGSISFPYAKFQAEAERGARTDLKYRDITESIDYSATIPTNFVIRPLDYVTLNDGVNSYQTRVTQIENVILIQGQLDDYPLVVAPQNTQITAGIERTIPVSVTKRKLPKQPQPPEPPKPENSPWDGRQFGLTLGDVVPKSMVGRGNY